MENQKMLKIIQSSRTLSLDAARVGHEIWSDSIDCENDELGFMQLQDHTGWNTARVVKALEDWNRFQEFALDASNEEVSQ